MLVDIVNESLSVLAHTEEICLLLGRLNRAAAIRTFAVYQLGLCKEGLAGSAVHSLVMALVNISLVVELLENLLDLSLVVCVCGADKLIIGSIH